MSHFCGYEPSFEPVPAVYIKMRSKLDSAYTKYDIKGFNSKYVGMDNGYYGRSNRPNEITLPLNINSDSSGFVFEKNGHIDTLIISYKRQRYLGRSHGYNFWTSNYKILKQTFDSIQTDSSSTSYYYFNNKSYEIFY